MQNFIKYLKNLLPVLLLFFLVSCDNKENSGAEGKTAETSSGDSVVTSKNIVFFGNSLTAGYGVDPSEAYPALIQAYIDSMHLDYKVINAGVSGETTAGGKARVDWILKQPVDIFVLELGGNDGLRGIPLEETRRNLQDIIDEVREQYPDVKVVLAGMQLPPNMGARYTTDFKNIFPDLAASNNITLIPFLLHNVGGEAKLNQADGIHPTKEGHEILAENVWEVLKDVVE